MKNKPILSVVVGLMTAAVLLTGCGTNSTNNSKGNTSGVTTTSGTTGSTAKGKTKNKNISATITVALPSGDYLKFFQKTVLPGFQKEYPNIKVNFSEATNSNNLTTEVAAGNPPDMNVGVWGYEPAEYAKAGKLVDISTLPGAKKLLNRIDQKFVVKNFGGVYYIPWNATTTMMIYNKNLFKKAGLNPNKPPQTFNEFLADAKKISALPPINGQKVYGTIFWNDALSMGAWYWPMLAPIYFNMNGGKYQLLNSYGTNIVFNKPAAKMADFFKFARKAQQYAPPNMKKNFFNRNVGMWLQFGYGWENNLQQAKGKPMVIGKDVGIAPVPVPKAGDQSWSTLDGRSLEIFKTTKVRDKAAWDLAQYLMKDSVNLAACKQLHQLPTLKSLESNAFFQTPDAKPFVKQEQHTLIDQPFAGITDAETAIEKAYIKTVIKRQITPAQAVQEAAKEASAALAKQGS